MCAFFDQGMDALSKHPGANDDPGLLCRGKRFLWFVSLTLIKEMNPPKAERFESMNKSIASDHIDGGRNRRAQNETGA